MKCESRVRGRGWLLSICVPALSCLTCAQEAPHESLVSRGVPADMAKRLVEARRSASDALLVRGDEAMVGAAKQVLLNSRMIRSAKIAAPLRAKAAVLRLAWRRTFPEFRNSDVLIDAVTRSKDGLSVRGELKDLRTKTLTTKNAVYAVVRIPLKGVDLRGCFPPVDVVKDAYLARLLAKTRSLERTKRGASALPLMTEHQRFDPLPAEFLPVKALCLSAGGQTDEARNLADSIWNSVKSGGSVFWVDLALLEERLGRSDRSNRAWDKQVDAWNRERWDWDPSRWK